MFGWHVFGLPVIPTKTWVEGVWKPRKVPSFSGDPPESCGAHFFGHSYFGCPWKLVTIVSKLGYFTYLGDEINLLILGLGHPVTKYHGHPSTITKPHLSTKGNSLARFGLSSSSVFFPHAQQ